MLAAVSPRTDSHGAIVEATTLRSSSKQSGKKRVLSRQDSLVPWFLDFSAASSFSCALRHAKNLRVPRYVLALPWYSPIDDKAMYFMWIAFSCAFSELACVCLGAKLCHA